MDYLLVFASLLSLLYLAIDAYVVAKKPRRVLSKLNIRERGVFLLIGLFAIMVEISAIVTNPMFVSLWMNTIIPDIGLAFLALVVGAGLGALFGWIATKLRPIIDSFLYFDVPIQFRPSA